MGNSDSKPSTYTCTAMFFYQWSPTFLAPVTGFMEDTFSMDQEGEGQRG